MADQSSKDLLLFHKSILNQLIFKQIQMSGNILDSLRNELAQNGDKENQIGAKRFFREPIKLYGLKTTDVNKIGKIYFKQIKDLSKKEIFGLCEKLWQSGMMEENYIACIWSYSLHKFYEKSDFKLFEKWINNYVTNWAACDTFCNHTMGTFLKMYSEFVLILQSWASSQNRWVRRASAVSLIIPAKKGNFLQEIFQITDILLEDKDDLVQKGYGWLLKAASQAHQKEVLNYVVKNKTLMSRTALRYAVEKMPKELKMKAMKK